MADPATPSASATPPASALPADPAQPADPVGAAEPTGAAEPAGAAERWLDPDEMAAWLAFLEVSHLLDRVIEQQLRQDAGLSHAQYEILSRLEAADGGRLRMSELADVIVVSRSGLTYQITQLENAAPGHLRVVRDNLIDALTPAQREALTEGLSAARARLRPAP
jgi:DNA-binding MarR family transcriptional regulator